jgi:hypothetical protein
MMETGLKVAKNKLSRVITESSEIFPCDTQRVTPLGCTIRYWELTSASFQTSIATANLLGGGEGRGGEEATANRSTFYFHISKPSKVSSVSSLNLSSKFKTILGPVCRDHVSRVDNYNRFASFFRKKCC